MFERLDDKLDPLGQSVLQIFRSIPIYKDAVLAGGYIRDHLMKGQFKDIDIFTPKIPLSSLFVPDDFKLVNTKNEDFGSAEYSRKFTVINLKYLEAIDVQLIITNFSVEGFKERLLNTFDYGICQVFAEDDIIYGTKSFTQDLSRSTATLLNLNYISDLPKAMKRFFRMQEKYPRLGFRCPHLSIRENNKDILIEYKPQPMYTLDESEQPHIPQHHGLTNDEAISMYMSYSLSNLTFDNKIDWIIVGDIEDLAAETGNNDLFEHLNNLLQQYDEMVE